MIDPTGDLILLTAREKCSINKDFFVSRRGSDDEISVSMDSKYWVSDSDSVVFANRDLPDGEPGSILARLAEPDRVRPQPA
jgi:hypothetical protein